MKAYNAQYKYNQQVCCRQEGKKTRNQKYVGIPSQQIQCKKRIAVHQDIEKNPYCLDNSNKQSRKNHANLQCKIQVYSTSVLRCEHKRCTLGNKSFMWSVVTICTVHSSMEFIQTKAIIFMKFPNSNGNSKEETSAFCIDISCEM